MAGAVRAEGQVAYHAYIFNVITNGCSFYHLCNSPGNVPSLQFIQNTLSGTCLGNAYYRCPLGIVMTGDSNSTTEPGGSRGIQNIYLSNPNYDVAFTDGYRYFNISFLGGTAANISVTASAAEIQISIEAGISSLNPNTGSGSRGVIVETSSDPVLAPNGQVITIHFLDEGTQPQFNVSKIIPQGYVTDPVEWYVNVQTVIAGQVYGLTAAKAGVVNGIVQRGNWTSLFVNGEPFASAELLWNAPAQGVTPFTNFSFKSQIESHSGHKVNVTQLVIGKYGVVQYTIRFVYNPGFFPPGAGHINLLNATQAPASNGVDYPPLIYETVRGSDGLSGVFDIDLHSDTGPRTVNFNETADRFRRKLMEMSTVVSVFVTVKCTYQIAFDC